MSGSRVTGSELRRDRRCRSTIKRPSVNLDSQTLRSGHRVYLNQLPNAELGRRGDPAFRGKLIRICRRCAGGRDRSLVRMSRCVGGSVTLDTQPLRSGRLGPTTDAQHCRTSARESNQSNDSDTQSKLRRSEPSRLDEMWGPLRQPRQSKFPTVMLHF